MSTELTEREFQVAELIAWGASKKEIPDLLTKLHGGKTISVHTVENIARNIYAKLHLNKASELSAWYFCKYHQVDEALSPIKKALRTLYSLVMLMIMLPQVIGADYDAVRTNRTKVENVSRTIRCRRKD